MTLKLMFDGGGKCIHWELRALMDTRKRTVHTGNLPKCKACREKENSAVLSHLFFLTTEIILGCMPIAVLCLDSSEVKPSLLWVETNILTEV